MNSLISNNLNLILTIYLHSLPERGIQVRPQTTPSSAVKGVKSCSQSSASRLIALINRLKRNTKNGWQALKQTDLQTDLPQIQIQM